MYCPRCGKEIPDYSRFCRYCRFELPADNGAKTGEPEKKEQPKNQKQPSKEKQPEQTKLPEKRKDLQKFQKLLHPKKSKKDFEKALIAILSGFLAVLLTVAGILLYLQTPQAKLKRQLSLGNRYLAEQNYEGAVTAFSNALGIEPKNQTATNGIITAYLGVADTAQDNEKKISAYENVLKYDDGNEAAYEKLSAVYLAQGDTKTAGEVIARAEEKITDPDIRKRVMKQKDRMDKCTPFALYERLNPLINFDDISHYQEDTRYYEPFCHASVLDCYNDMENRQIMIDILMDKIGSVYPESGLTDYSSRYESYNTVFLKEKCSAPDQKGNNVIDRSLAAEEFSRDWTAHLDLSHEIYSYQVAEHHGFLIDRAYKLSDFNSVLKNLFGPAFKEITAEELKLYSAMPVHTLTPNFLYDREENIICRKAREHFPDDGDYWTKVLAANYISKISIRDDICTVEIKHLKLDFRRRISGSMSDGKQNFQLLNRTDVAACLNRTGCRQIFLNGIPVFLDGTEVPVLLGNPGGEYTEENYGHADGYTDLHRSQYRYESPSAQEPLMTEGEAFRKYNRQEMTDQEVFDSLQKNAEELMRPANPFHSNLSVEYSIRLILKQEEDGGFQLVSFLKTDQNIDTSEQEHPEKETAENPASTEAETSQVSAADDKVPDPTAPVVQVVSVYTVNKNKSGLQQEMDSIDYLDASLLMQKLIQAQVVDAGTAVINFSCSDRKGILNLSAFAKQDLQTIAAVGNTYIENFNLDLLTIQVNGVAVNRASDLKFIKEFGTYNPEEYTSANQKIPPNMKAAEFSGHHYAVLDNCGSWEDAKKYCEMLGGHLAIISSQDENDFIYQMITAGGYQNAYFGYTDSKQEGRWRWVDGTPGTYTNWGNGEPNGQNPLENYAMFYEKYSDGRWNDGDFGAGHQNTGIPYICEWDY